MRDSFAFTDKKYVGSVQIILICTALAKLFSAFGKARILVTTDPLLDISNRNLLIISGLIELSVVAYVYFGRNALTKVLLIQWLSIVFILYRMGNWWLGFVKPCPCLGNLTDMLHISPRIADNAMKIILAYLLIGSSATLFWLWRQKRKNLPASTSSEPPVPAS